MAADHDPGQSQEDAQAAQQMQHTSELLRRYADDDLDALNQLFERHYPRVVRVVRSRIEPRLRRKLDVEDCVQEVFVDAFRGVQRFDYRGPGSFMNWLATVALHRLSNERERWAAVKRDVNRERALESVRAAISSGSLAFEPAADTSWVPEKAARGEETDRLVAALDKLPEDLRRAAELRWMLECTLLEVAELMELPNDMAAHRLCTKARVELGRRLGEMRPGD